MQKLNKLINALKTKQQAHVMPDFRILLNFGTQWLPCIARLLKSANGTLQNNNGIELNFEQENKVSPRLSAKTGKTR